MRGHAICLGFMIGFGACAIMSERGHTSLSVRMTFELLVMPASLFALTPAGHRRNRSFNSATSTAGRVRRYATDRPLDQFSLASASPETHQLRRSRHPEFH